ncbi:MAG TPA: MerR family transcriptional regulator [Nocardioides sp.]|nr:MerR family transcriptional regulator [Nocardioides sp.]
MGERARGVYAISVAAEMTSLQVQNLRVYERRGLLEPDRTEGGTRLYSRADIERLHRIRDLLADGLNLAGIARVLELEAEVARLRRLAGSASRAPSRTRR